MLYPDYSTSDRILVELIAAETFREQTVLDGFYIIFIQVKLVRFYDLKKKKSFF